MIYDRVLEVFEASDADSPLKSRLTLLHTHFCAQQTVYHRTFYASLQAGETVDLMVQLPRTSEIDASMYAVPEDGHVYKILEAQPTKDEDGLPVYVLSLHRKGDNYELLRP